jgi:hypothetical protein
MGRPLKTRKYQADTDTVVDNGFPNDGTTDNGWSDNDPGIVGGYDGPIRVTMNINIPGAGTVAANTASATVTGTGTQFAYNGLAAGSVVYANGVEIGTVDAVANATSFTLTANSAANVSGATYTFDTGARNGYILRQKGKRKFMAVLDTTVEDEGIASGGQYMITSASNTDWNALGAGVGAGYGKVFTANANGVGLATNGTVAPVAVCTLVQDGAPAAGELSMEVYNDGDTYYATAITNHWVSSDEDDTTKYVATIFNDSGNVDEATGYTIVGVENWC